MDNYLSQLEKDKINLFLADPVMTETVKKVLLEGVYRNGVLSPDAPADPKRNFLLAIANKVVNPMTGQEEPVSNEQLGAELRAAFEGVRMVETAFKRLEDYKHEPEPEAEPANKAL
jgi:hypothetical protein